MRIFSWNYNINDGLKQQLLYGVAVLVCVVSIFGIIIFLSYFSDPPSNEGFPSATPGTLSNFSVKKSAPQVAGAKTQSETIQQLPEGPDIPSPKPSASPSPSPSLSPSPSASPSPTLSPTPSPENSSSNSTPTPTPTPSPSVKPSESPSPSLSPSPSASPSPTSDPNPQDSPQ